MGEARVPQRPHPNDARVTTATSRRRTDTELLERPAATPTSQNQQPLESCHTFHRRSKHEIDELDPRPPISVVAVVGTA